MRRLFSFGRRRPAEAVILLYHRIAALPRDPFRLNVRPESFAAHLEVVSDLAPVVPLSAIVAGEHGERAVAITFDDGYADNVRVAAPLLARYGLPATLFLVSGAVDSDGEFWWDQLERCLLEPENLPSELRLRFGDDSRRWTLPPHPFTPAATSWRDWCVYFGDTPSPRHALLRELVPLFTARSSSEKRTLLAALAEWAGLPAGARETHRAATAAELDGLERTIEVGAHTCTHPRLAGLSAELQREEVQGSKRELESRLGRAIDLFAYPHGGRGDYDERSTASVRAAGFRAACASVPGRVSATTDRFQLPRHLVYDDDREAFARRLSGWLADATA